MRNIICPNKRSNVCFDKIHCRANIIKKVINIKREKQGSNCAGPYHVRSLTQNVSFTEKKDLAKIQAIKSYENLLEFVSEKERKIDGFNTFC